VFFGEGGREGGGVRGRGRERISSSLQAEHGAGCGAQSHDPEIVT